MTIQLNPDTADGFETKTLAEIRTMVFDAFGFLDQLDYANPPDEARTLAMIRASIINRLGLAIALLANTATYDSILTFVYNECGFAAMSTHPPGIDSILGGFINQAQRTIFADINSDKGGVTAPTDMTSGNSTSVDGTAVRMLALAMSKAHFEQPDAAAHKGAYDKYMADLLQRTPPNITGQVNAAIIAANMTAMRRWEFGKTGSAVSRFGFYTQNASQSQGAAAYVSSTSAVSIRDDGAVPDVDDNAVELLALANLKKKIGQADADDMHKQYEQQLADRVKRLPPNAYVYVNRKIKDMQDMLYQRYSVFRMERWYTWALDADQRFIGTFDDDNASSIAPTDLVATIGGSVTAHEMISPRMSASIVKLNNGTVLVAGGVSSFSVYSTPVVGAAEIYNPATGVFTATGSMVTPRANALSALLEDGTVLICGGTNGTFLQSAEIYHPSTGTFTAVGSMAGLHSAGVLVALPNGTALVAGGVTLPFTAVATAEIYDPITQTFSTTGSMGAARFAAAASLLPDGGVLVTGGGHTAALNTAEIYRTSSGTFTTLSGTMVNHRNFHAQVTLPDGNVLLAGGIDQTAANLATTEIYLTLSGTFSAAGSMSEARQSPLSALMPSGNVLLAGGIALDGTTADIFNPSTQVATPTGSMPYEVSSSRAILLGNGKVLIPGGLDSAGTVYKTALLFDEDSGDFNLTGSLTQGTTYYKITAFTANGESLPSLEVFVTSVPVDTSVVLTWVAVPNQPFVVGFKIYRGKVTGEEEFIAIASNAVTTYTDDGTIPADGPLPTINATAGPGALDARRIKWAGISQDDRSWRPLIRGIPPTSYTPIQTGIPHFYDVRQAIEIWPAPRDDSWSLRIKGYFKPAPLDDDFDRTSMDWQAVYYATIAECSKKFDKDNVASAQAQLRTYIGDLVAGSYATQRFLPGGGVNNVLPTPPVRVP